MSQLLDVTGIGNAIVDVIAHATDADIARLALAKGSMTLIDEAQASALYAGMAPAREISGGSVANSIAGVAALGGTAGYIGKTRNDQLGEVFAHDIRAAGVSFGTAASTSGAATARCLILVTPDGQRTMSTYLGACVGLGPEDIDEALLARSKVTYIEGYLWDPPRAKEAILRAAQLAHQHGRKVALSLSDAFCVNRHRTEFSRLLDDHVDILFANESEALALTQTSDYDAALKALRGRAEISVVTRGAAGASVIGRDELVHVPAEPIEKLVDTTGAGDLFAAGFLFGHTHGRSLADSARIGALCAAEIISHYGARPEQSLSALLASRGL
ncbi:MAG TPA: adenosine kinase [Polyangiales bacterium]